MKKLIPLVISSLAGFCIFTTALANEETEYKTVSEASTEAPAAAKNFGLGLSLGEPSGLNAKYWLSETTAIDGGLAWAFGNETSIQAHADFLIHNRTLLRVNEEPLMLYYGAGTRLKFDAKDTLFGIRVPVGLSYEFQEEPIDLSFEVAPILNLAPRTSVSINVGVIGRYYF
jgi:hypothetical protein